MSQKAIREYDGKTIISRELEQIHNSILTSHVNTTTTPFYNQHPVFHINPDTNISEALTLAQNRWLHTTRLVIKPDQLIKRRGKSGLLALNVTIEEAITWIEEKRGKSITVDNVTDVIDTFIIEPFIPHTQLDEYYVCIHTTRDGDEILFTHEGGIEVGDVDAKAKRMLIPVLPENEKKSEKKNEKTEKLEKSEKSEISTITTDTSTNVILSIDTIKQQLLEKVPTERQDTVATFLSALYQVFQTLHFAYLEINPLVYTPQGMVILDLAAKLDEAAKFEIHHKWGNIEFPAPFGRKLLPAEEFIRDLDAKTGASLKLTILNPKGRVWLMVAGGGASVIYADSVCDAGYAHELANYGEYSGAPTEGQTYLYAKTVLELLLTEHQPTEEDKKKTSFNENGDEMILNNEGVSVKRPQKTLLIGGGIANFTDVAATFKGVIRALVEHQDELRRQNVQIWVRRAGPNYQEGLELMKNTGTKLGITMHVYGPELHMTAIVPLSLGLPFDTTHLHEYQNVSGSSFANTFGQKKTSPSTGNTPLVSPNATTVNATNTNTSTSTTANKPNSTSKSTLTLLDCNKESSSISNLRSITPAHGTDIGPAISEPSSPVDNYVQANIKVINNRLEEESKTVHDDNHENENVTHNHTHTTTKTITNTKNHLTPLFTPNTRCIVYGLQTGAVQNMLDFDILCKRQKPSVACLVYPFMPNHYQKFYWNNTEILIPCIQELSEAKQRFTDVDTLVSFASFRSVYESTMEAFDIGGFKTIALIAEGVPERRSREILHRAKRDGVTIIGPATVGGVKPGAFRIGNAGGMLDNIVNAKLYRPGSVAYVTRSGGMSNELNNILALNSDGVAEGIAIGGDMYPGSTFVDHLLRYQADPNVKMLIVLGEVGGLEEYRICELLKEKKITKPLVAWCIGTCSRAFSYEVQFGHAGACSTGFEDSAVAKNEALRQAGAYVPNSFDEFGRLIGTVYKKLVNEGILVPKVEPVPPVVPVDYAWARKLGLIRKPSSFISSISDERGDELKYAGVPISKVLDDGLGIGGTLGLLWFRRKLPKFVCEFIEMVLILTADHGPAVSGAHNTIVTARAGKDVISSLCAGLLTVGPRFGGALDDAARCFSIAVDNNQTPDEFVESMRKKKELIPGIGHKIKSLEDPDARVKAVKEFMAHHMPYAPVFEFACKVELITTRKKSNLILNVDGVVAAAFVDIMRSCGQFSVQEANEYMDMGILNGLFVLGRSIGFIGHWIDQNRFKQPLYRHPTDDISYISEDY